MWHVFCWGLYFCIQVSHTLWICIMMYLVKFIIIRLCYYFTRLFIKHTILICQQKISIFSRYFFLSKMPTEPEPLLDRQRVAICQLWVSFCDSGPASDKPKTLGVPNTGSWQARIQKILNLGAQQYKLSGWTRACAGCVPSKSVPAKALILSV